MQARHHEVKSEEYLRMTRICKLPGMPGDLHVVETERSARDVMLFELFSVFNPFNAQKDEAEKHGNHEHADQERAAGGLRRPDGKDNGQTAADEYAGVGGAEVHIDCLPARREVAEIPPAVNQVAAEQAPEKHDFRRQEHPHAETGCIALLLRCGEVVQQSWIVRNVSLAVMVVNRGKGAGAGVILQRGPPRYEARLTPRSCKLPRSQPVLGQS